MLYNSAAAHPFSSSAATAVDAAKIDVVTITNPALQVDCTEPFQVCYPKRATATLAVSPSQGMDTHVKEVFINGGSQR